MNDAEEQLTALTHMPTHELRANWRKIYRAEPPKRTPRDLLMRAVAYPFNTFIRIFADFIPYITEVSAFCGHSKISVRIHRRLSIIAAFSRPPPRRFTWQ